MKYCLCEFEYGYEGQFYQESDGNGFIRFIDLNCNTLEVIPPYGCFIVEEDISKPDCLKD